MKLLSDLCLSSACKLIGQETRRFFGGNWNLCSTGCMRKQPTDRAGPTARAGHLLILLDLRFYSLGLPKLLEEIIHPPQKSHFVSSDSIWRWFFMRALNITKMFVLRYGLCDWKRKINKKPYSDFAGESRAELQGNGDASTAAATSRAAARAFFEPSCLILATSTILLSLSIEMSSSLMPHWQ